MGEAVNKAEYSKNQFYTITSCELMDIDFPLRQALIDGILYEGTYLFVGPPKTGKSFCVAQICYSIAEGLPIWGFKVKKTEVLYLALEDDYSRLQQRLSTMFGVEGSANLHLAIRSEKMNEGLVDQINSFLSQHPDTKLVVIDTLQKIRDESGDGYSYKNDYDVIVKLKTISDEKRICILLVHHSRKMGAEDQFDMISGTSGLMGAADGAFMLMKKKRTDQKAELCVVGRDQPGITLKLEFAQKNCVWELKDSQTDVIQKFVDEKLEMINAFMSDDRKVWEGSAQELLNDLNYHDTQASAFSRYLNVHKTELYSDYGILFERLDRTNQGRKIRLTKESA